MPMKMPLLPISVLVTVLALTLTSCFNERDENTNEGTNPSPGELVVEVELTDDGIEMPDEVTVTEAVDEGGAPLNDEGVGPSEEQDPIEDEGP